MCVGPFAQKSQAPQIIASPAPHIPTPVPGPIESAPAPVIRPKSARKGANAKARGKSSLRIERSGLSPVGSGVQVPA